MSTQTGHGSLTLMTPGEQAALDRMRNKHPDGPQWPSKKFWKDLTRKPVFVIRFKDKDFWVEPKSAIFYVVFCKHPNVGPLYHTYRVKQFSYVFGRDNAATLAAIAAMEMLK